MATMATMAAAGERVRDVKNHLLFEIATEVAHRGKTTVNGLSSLPCFISLPN